MFRADHEAICRKRMLAGYTQAGFADAVKTSHSNLHRIEQGTQAPRPPLLSRMAAVLRCEIADLMVDEPAEKAS
jgi:transcriptional regulator with XRE-family HTH domain